MKIYNLGSLNIDYVYTVEHFVRAGETLASNKMELFPGGKGLNQSVALARAGAAVIHGGIVGAKAEPLTDTLKNSGVDISRIRHSENVNGHAIIQVDSEGQNCIMLYRGTNGEITREYVEAFLLDAEADDILLLQNEINGLDFIFEIAERHSLQIAFNPSPITPEILKLPLGAVKWWFCNETEAEALFGSSDPKEITDRFIKKYPNANLILTLGSDGSIFKSRDLLIHQPIFKTEAVDTTAAGDTFTGYFTALVSKGESIEAAMKKAAKASSVTVSRKGASVSIPTVDEL